MPDQNPPRDAGMMDGATVAGALEKRAPRDIAFVKTVLGESRDLLTRHFEGVIRTELERRGAALSESFVRPFIDVHAAELRDFVLSGVALSHSFRIEQIEQMMGDSTTLMRVDIWDALTRHIEAAAERFRAQADDIPRMLEALEANRRASRTPT